MARSKAGAAEQPGGEQDAPNDGTSSASPAVEILVAPRGETQRPGGLRFGRLVHGMLAVVDLDATEPTIRALAAIQARLFDATAEEREAAVEVVKSALQHPVLRRAAASAKTAPPRRETPVLLALDDGPLVEGVVDLAFREQDAAFDGWTVIDFKTDAEFSTSTSQYVRQVKLYAEAIKAATALPTRGILLIL